MILAVYIIILAAGASRRMTGKDKLTQNINGIPLLRHSAQQALASQSDGVLVVLPNDRPARDTVLSGLPITVVKNPDARKGLSSSLICGLEHLPEHIAAAIIIPADMPDIKSEHYDMLIARWQKTGRICRATTADHKPGNPVLFPDRYFDMLQNLEGDTGANPLLRKMADPIEDVTLPGQVAQTDLDTPEDWETWLLSNR